MLPDPVHFVTILHAKLSRRTAGITDSYRLEMITHLFQLFHRQERREASGTAHFLSIVIMTIIQTADLS